MIKIYAEYKVLPEMQADYLVMIPKLADEWLAAGAEQPAFYRAVDQADLYVEEGTVPDRDGYERLKLARRDPAHPVWSRLHDLLAGGADGLHIWGFERLDCRDAEAGG